MPVAKKPTAVLDDPPEARAPPVDPLEAARQREANATRPHGKGPAAKLRTIDLIEELACRSCPPGVKFPPVQIGSLGQHVLAEVSYEDLIAEFCRRQMVPPTCKKLYVYEEEVIRKPVVVEVRVDRNGDELPMDRQPVQTKIVTSAERRKAVARGERSVQAAKPAAPPTPVPTVVAKPTPKKPVKLF
jgi:hypothetical protein